MKSAYGVLWFEFIVSLILGRIIQEVYHPEVGLIILVPVLVTIIHLVFGRLLEKYLNKDIF